MACECDGPCICPDLDELMDEIGKWSVGQTSFVHSNQFDVGIGRNLANGEFIVNLFLHEAGPYREDDASMFSISFGKEESARLIRLLMMAYHTNWSAENE